MPLLIKIEAKKVNVKDNNVADILSILKVVLDKSTLDKTNAAQTGNLKEVQSKLGSSAMKQREGCWATLAPSLEKLTGDHYGAQYVDLQELEVSLELPAIVLREGYIDFLNQLLLKENIDSLATEKEVIDDPFVLVREVMIRFASVALSKEWNVKADGDELMYIFDQFVGSLQSSNILLKSPFFGRKKISGSVAKSSC